MAILNALLASSIVAISLLTQAATPVNALAAPAHAHAARHAVTPNHNGMLKRHRKRNTNPLRKRCVAQDNSGSSNSSSSNSGGSDNSGSTGDNSGNTGNNSGGSNTGGGGNNVITGGFATYYWQNGNAGACGNYHSDWDYIGAIDIAWYGDDSQQSQYCGRSVTITNLNNGKSVTITVADVCPTCDTSNSFDLSYGAFTAIASEADGEVPITWYFN